jgi:hypothetical protein
VGFRYHLGGKSVTVDPSRTNWSAPSLTEILMRFASDQAARQVLDEARLLARVCTSYTAAGGLRYSVSLVAEGFAGDDSVQLNLIELPAHPNGAPATHTYAFVQVGRAVILLRPSKAVEDSWLQGIARSAAGRA